MDLLVYCHSFFSVHWTSHIYCFLDLSCNFERLHTQGQVQTFCRVKLDAKEFLRQLKRQLFSELCPKYGALWAWPKLVLEKLLKEFSSFQISSLQGGVWICWFINYIFSRLTLTTTTFQTDIFKKVLPFLSLLLTCHRKKSWVLVDFTASVQKPHYITVHQYRFLLLLHSIYKWKQMNSIKCKSTEWWLPLSQCKEVHT